jgi:transcriptional regulator with XRE-family HTH domain
MSDSQDQIVNVGKIVRDLRRTRGLTGKELGEKAQMSQSKISKIETGFYIQLIPAEIEIILNILNAPKTITQQVMSAIEDNQLTARGISRTNWRDLNNVLDQERKSQLTRMFMFGGPPAFLQTLEYRRHILATYNRDTTEIKNQSIDVKRQDLLWDGQHRYNVIIHEAGLYTIFSPQLVHLAQLDRLERLLDAEYIRLGVMPLQAGLITFEHSSFVLYDERLLVAIVGSNEIEFDNPRDIVEHKNMFEVLEKKACYGDEARTLIRNAVDYFNIK